MTWGRVVVFAGVASLTGCGGDDDDGDGVLTNLFEQSDDFMGEVVKWLGLFVLFVLLATAAFVLLATWLRRRRSDRRDN